MSTIWLGSPDGRIVSSTSLFDSSSSSGSSRLPNVREVNNGPDEKSGGDGDLLILNLEVSTCLTDDLWTPSPAATLSRTNVPGINVNSSLGSTHSSLRTLSMEVLVGIRSGSAVARERTPVRLIWENEGDPLSEKLYRDI